MKISSRIGHAKAMMRELGRKAKLSVFRAVFVPILTYGHEIWVISDWIGQAGAVMRELEQAFDRFSAVCCNAGMKIGVEKSEVTVISRMPVECNIQASGTPLRKN